MKFYCVDRNGFEVLLKYIRSQHLWLSLENVCHWRNLTF